MNDLISRQAAIEALREMYHSAEKWGQEAEDDTIKARAESCMASLVEMKLRIEKLPSAQQWIPVSERLPEHQQEVVIKTMNGVTEVMRFCNCYFERFGMDESIDWYAQNEVEVWMPLPEPYRGGTK